MIDLEFEKSNNDIEKYYSEKSIVNIYRVIRLSSSDVVVKKTLVPTKSEGSFIIKPGPKIKSNNLILNFLIKRNRVKNKSLSKK